MKYLLLLYAIVTFSFTGSATEKKETIRREVDFRDLHNKALWVDNINGSITIETYQGTSAQFEIEKYVRAESDDDFNTIWKKLNPVILTGSDTMEIYINGLCECDCNNRRGHYRHQCDFEGHFNFNFNIKVRIPEKTDLRLSTVNNGDIRVNGVIGAMKVNNVNGGIILEQVTGNTDVHTINGDVTVKYARNPTYHSRYYTLNGKLQVYYRSDLSADMNFKSFNGSFYTDFSIAETLPSRLVTNADGEKGTKWRLEEKTAVRVGQGGLSLDFETFNGDIYIRKL